MVEVKKNRLFIVLGMHRSGTSTITRGLRVMGVDLGTRLIPAIEGNNAKGFWEDIDLNTFDNEVLAELGGAWSRLAAINAADVDTLKKQGYFLRAVELLRSKLADAPLFGFKDPRIAKLLPFWREVFAYCGIDVSYIIALRHPLSVAQSLAKRDAMELEQSYLLWLGHVIPSLTYSAGKPRVVIDYDQVMQSPDTELMRLASSFNLQMDAGALEDYRNEFLDQELRHTVYAPEDLLLDGRCPPLVYEIYSMLRDLAMGKRTFGEPEVEAEIVRWGQEFDRMLVALRLADRLSQREHAAVFLAKDREGEIGALHQRVEQRDLHLAELQQLMSEHENHLRSTEQQLEVQSLRVMELGHELQERDGILVERQMLIEEFEKKNAQLQMDATTLSETLRETLHERENILATLREELNRHETELAVIQRERASMVEAELAEAAAHHHTVTTQEQLAQQHRMLELEQAVDALKHQVFCHQCHIQELELAVGSADHRVATLSGEHDAIASHHHSLKSDYDHLRNVNLSLQQQIEQTHASRSWRITAPLRKVSAAPRKARRALFGMAVASYRALPLTPMNKQRLKNGVFRHFGFALKRSEAYQRWLEFQQIQRNWAAPAVPAQPAAPVQHGDQKSAVSNPALPVADGVWEWQDYAAVKANIAQVKANRLGNVAPTPFDMIDIKHADLRRTAKSLALPAVVSMPDVSIIIPVFNNVKLTLECLASIAQHVENDVTFEVLLADDASTDETEELMSLVANIRYSRSDSNLGFLRNCNRVLGDVKGRYVLYLNNDVQVTAGWLATLLATFKNKPNVGAVGPRFVYPSGHLQEAGVAFTPDGAATMIGLNDDPQLPRYSYLRRVDYVSGACLLLPTELARKIGGFSEEFLPCYCEDADMCLSVRDAGYDIYYNPAATIIHHLSKTTADGDNAFKMRCINKNLSTLKQKWSAPLDSAMIPRLIAFFLPQYHPIVENDQWWGKGFTEWTNVSKAQPNFVGHYQPRVPADLGYYDLRLIEVMQQQAELAQRYGVHGFCYYYYWFDGHRLLERPVEQLLLSDEPKLPFCLCWANENWTRRWDGQEHEVLMAQSHTVDDDKAVINDLIRFFKDARYIKIDGRPLLLIYRVTLFPNFAETAARWRTICREQGIGEIYIAMVESFDLVHSNTHPSTFGCDAAVEFPPQGLAEQKAPSGEILNPNFAGSVADYRDLAVRYATREAPAYTRFKGVMPGWDNTARRQGNSFCFEHATPGAFQGWLEETIDETRKQHFGDERLVFVNAWNEWAEGAYLEPDRRFGHTYLEAVRNAREAGRLLGKNNDGK